MGDKIQLLPEHLANQIAAGEVIQRPASVVKELLENAVDAGADDILLIVEEAGKRLIQVVDNGCGMSETDARMSFERHATSKIRDIDDLYRIRTMGFRGEALASIAAVAEVEMRTRPADQQLGTCIEIANGRILRQEPCACQPGTQVQVKNLFFSVPARRHFLKSDAVELRHIWEEFNRVALAFPEVGFSFIYEGELQLRLEKSSLKQRVLQLLGKSYADKLIAVQEKTPDLYIHGFVGKPDTAKKSRGDQYFFVNRRFIRSNYLHHAISSALAPMIPADSHPVYVLFLNVDPAEIDVNVHPTKQEIKFGDEKMIYAFVQAAVRHALAVASVTPALDFELPADIQQSPALNQPLTPDQQTRISHSPLYLSFTRPHQAHVITPHRSVMQEKPVTAAPDRPPIEPEIQSTGQSHNWLSLYESLQSSVSSLPQQAELALPANAPEDQVFPVQLHLKWILQPVKSGFILLHQHAAHERILYETYQQAFLQQPIAIQACLFPQVLELAPADQALLEQIRDDLRVLGYQLERAGNTNNFVIQGIPADLPPGFEKQTLTQLLAQCRNEAGDLRLELREKMIRSLARQHAVPAGRSLTRREMQQLIDQLFACKEPEFAPSGKRTYIWIRDAQLEKWLTDFPFADPTATGYFQQPCS
ncbi:DNA mismatch repair endonuclease MutL [Thermoflavifilum thermophilum]|uniref:DNA mismatch repair protein MutL n=1 Tax=Thermoflavifilum thermophilum TaxID=1393122 RepID=A0A1I7ND20_9BACT|nr:DNA mismatch repair endonuclease MutL [Thermoflavifilum thermophilum]SFV32574.1 DNA mismatch repair protein MutL [Thermoflavifilum thermophilum]